MKRVLSSRNCRAYRMAASLPVALFVSSLLIVPMGLAADQHTHHGDVGEASTEKVIYREGGAVLHDRMMEEVKRQQEAIGQKGGIAPARTVTCCSRVFCW